MTNDFSLKVFITSLLVLPMGIPAYAQQVANPSFGISGHSTGITDKYTDDEGHDLLNPPLLIKYGHGLKRIEGNGIRGRLPAGPVDPKSREKYFAAQELRDVGFAYLAYRRYDRAIAQLNEARLLWPDSAANYRWLAEAYEANGQTKEAIANYRLLFYGWPGKYAPDEAQAKPKDTPPDKPSDYDQPNPEETDATLLMQFSLLLQKTKEYPEAQAVYERGMQVLSDNLLTHDQPSPPMSAAALTTPEALEAATRLALAINQMSYQDKAGARENLSRARQLQPTSTEASFYQQKLSKQ